eukprot:Sdes_comp15093_c0_seq1m3889
MDITKLMKNAESKIRDVEVKKEIPVQFDIGNLLVSDPQPLDQSRINSDSDFCMKTTRENVQLLINEIWKLPTQIVEDAVVAHLPAPTTALPREKSVPKPKPPTKWEVFAKAKGIVKRKRERMVYDEAQGEYKPRFGYQGINQNDKPWLVPLSDQENPLADPYEKMKVEKKARIEKNEKQRKRNLVSSKKSLGVDPLLQKEDPKLNMVQMKKEKLLRALESTKLSTASVGNFDKDLKDEPKSVKKIRDRHRNPSKAQSVTGNFQMEKQRYMAAVAKVASHEDVLNVKKAAQHALPEVMKKESSTPARPFKVAKQGRRRKPQKK